MACVNSARACQKPRSPAPSIRRWKPCACPTMASGGSTRCQAASNSASPWPAPSSTNRRFCCSTSRWRRWTKSCAATCRSSLQTLQRQLGITFVLVTHDQEEALSMSDRICVMQGGKIVQIGSPRTLYDCPNTRYVADFVGKTNFFEGTVTATGDTLPDPRRGIDAFCQRAAPLGCWPDSGAFVAARTDRAAPQPAHRSPHHRAGDDCRTHFPGRAYRIPRHEYRVWQIPCAGSTRG